MSTTGILQETSVVLSLESGDDLAIESAYVAEVLADNPVSYWRLGEPSGTLAKDARGANDGTYVASPTLGVTGPITTDGNTAVTLNGSTQWITTGAGVGLPTGATARTVEAWIKPSGSTKGTIISYGTASTRQAFGFAWDVGVGGVRVLEVWTWSDDGTVSTPTLNDGNWHHIVATYNGVTTIAIYLDGAFVANRSAPGAALNTVVDANGLHIGKDFNGSGHPHNGGIDEVAIYATALSSTRIAAHYAAATQ